MRGRQRELYIGPSIEHITPSDFLLHQDNYLLLSGKRNLMIMNRQAKTIVSYKLSDLKILAITYHPCLDVYLVCTNKSVMYFNHSCQLIKQQKIPQLSEINFMLLLEMEDGYYNRPNYRKDKLLFTTAENIFLGQLQIFNERGMVNNKALCDISVQFTHKPSIVLDSPQWVDKVKYMKSLNTFICWNYSQAYFYTLPTSRDEQISTNFIYSKISKRQNQINDFQISFRHRFLIAGYEFGTIKIYKYDETKKFVFNLKGHQRECVSLFIAQNDQNFVYSAGLDSTVRIWDLLDFNQLYHIKIGIIIDEIKLLSEKVAFIKFNESRKSALCSYNIDLLSPVLNNGNSGTVNSLMSDGQWGIVLYSSNYGECFLLEDCARTQKIQFPLQYGKLRNSLKFKDNCYLIYIENGFSIISLSKEGLQSVNFELKKLVYNHSLRQSKKQEKNVKFIELIHEKLLDTFLFSTLEDWKGIPFTIKVTSVTMFFQAVIPMWDLNLRGKTATQKKDFVILGTDKGYTYFVDLKNRHRFYTRLHYHSTPITSIKPLEISQKKHNSQMYFFSITETSELGIWSFNLENNPQLKYRIQHSSSISLITIFKDYMVVGYHTGKFSIMKFKELGEELGCYYDPKNAQQGHLKKIIAVDHIEFQNKDIFLSVSEDSVLKFWLGLQKQLLLEVKLFNEINDAIFIKQQVDILISHGENNQISILRSQKIKEFNLVKKIKLLELTQTLTEIDLKVEIGATEEKIKKIRTPSPKNRSISPKSNKIFNQFQNSSSLDNSGIREVNDISKSMKISLISNEKRKQRYNHQKKVTQSILQNQSLILPRLPANKNAQFRNISSRKGSILEKVQITRGKSFSMAGRKQF